MLLMSLCKVQCPRCIGKGWIDYKNDESNMNRKLKCEVCDYEGMAHVQDIIDFYSYISDKAPETDKVNRWESYLKMETKDSSDCEGDSVETEG